MSPDYVTSTSHCRPDTLASRYEAVSRVIAAMAAHPDQEFSLRALAEIAFASPFHFNRVFRQITGLPPCQFLSAVRLDAARRMLLTTRLRVTDICFEVGYNSLGTFTTRFTQCLGVSPLQLRRLAMQDWSALIESTVPLTPKSVGLLGGNVVRGRVATTVRFEGLILIGLFPLPIPQGKPTACTLLTSPGTYSIHQVPNGRHYIFAAALESVQGRFSPLMNGDALRGRPQHGPIVVQDCQIAGSTDIVLRPAEVTDPPVLTVLPVLLSNLVESRADAAEPAAVYGYV